MEKELAFAARLVSLVLSRENPPNIGLILSHMDATMAAAVFSTLPDEIQADVIYNVAVFGTEAAQASKVMEETATPEIKALLQEQGFSGIGGARVVAEILRRVGRPTEAAVLKHLDEKDAEIAEGVRSNLIAFGDIAILTDREIQMILREVDMKDLSVALRGASEELQNRIFMNMSKDVGTKLKEEMDLTGPVRVSDVEAMQKRVVEVMRTLEEAGQVTPVRCSNEALL